MLTYIRTAVTVCSVATVLGSGSIHAQTFVATPAIPSGFGLSGNTLAVSLSGAYDNSRPVGNRLDASTSLAFGFGDPVDGIGVQASVNLTSFRMFGASGYGALTLHRMFQTNSSGIFSISGNLTYIAPWGNAARLPMGGSVVGSYLFGINGRLGIATLGATNDLNAARRVQPVVGFGYQVADDIAVSAGWAGEQSVLGIGWQPPMLGGTTVNLSVRAVEDNARRSIGLDITHAFNLRN